MVNIVAIPTIGESELLWPLLDTLLADKAVGSVFVFDNGMPLRPAVRLLEAVALSGGRLVALPALELSIYGMWNEAIQSAWAPGVEVNVAVLNDDIRLPPGAVGVMGEMLRSDPELVIVSPDYLRRLDDEAMLKHLRYVHGTFRHHGVAGFAFMVKAERCPKIDERFVWWYGDDDLVCQIEDAGGTCAIVEGLPVEHATSTSGSKQGWVAEAVEADGVLFREKWGDR